ncbi:DUF341 domain protein [Hypoxylon sp. FL1284]|nr:DUF341 domain protein [Hypoxylon sp. FL1284]
MRFLCLHGIGTNAKIFETQTAAIRYELGDQHTYRFVEGTLLSTAAPEIEKIATASDEYFSYFDVDDASSLVSSLHLLDRYLTVEGPFDGIMAFSQGVTLAATYLAYKRRKGCQPDAYFKCAIFFSAAGLVDLDSLGRGHIIPSKAASELECIPSAHIWGRNDLECPAPVVADAFSSENREVYVHEGGHEIPGPSMNASVKACVRIIRRTVSRGNSSA